MSETQGLDSKKADSAKSINDILPFLQFVESHGVGSIVEGVVESYSSHGAYVQIGEVRGYVPLRLLGDPPPRSARDAMKLGDVMTLEIVEIIAGRRSVNLKPAVAARSKKGVVKAPAKIVDRAAPGKSLIAKKAATKTANVKKAGDKVAAVKKTPAKKIPAVKAASTKAVKKATPKKAASKVAGVKQVPAKKAVSTIAKKKANAPVKKVAKKEAAKKRPATHTSAASKSAVKKR
jgi:ribosomal protein S1